MVNQKDLKLTEKSKLTHCEFNFCRHCAFYPCELIGEFSHFRNVHKGSVNTDSNSSPVIRAIVKSVDDPAKNTIAVSAVSHNSVPVAVSYDKEEVKNGCVMSPRNVCQVECGKCRVSEGIGDHYKIETAHDCSIVGGVEDRWDPSQPVFISAQTGQGKNYFIEHTLIPYVKELNYKNRTEFKVLILSNRLALKRQIKNRLERSDDVNDEEREVYHLSDTADVMTYQNLLYHEEHLVRRQRSGKSKYLFVVCDEAHFFTSDATFNPNTQKILSTIVRVFKNAVRIYLSATPYECLPYIVEHEESNSQYHMMVCYHFKRDYEYLDAKTYLNIEELFGRIVESIHKRNERWLIFIDDKVKCRTIKEKLEAYGKEKGYPMVTKKKDSEMEMIFAVDAESKENPDYKAMVLAESLTGGIRVLITTSVLDNGVNLNDINHIVVSDMSKVKVLQMVGRARVRGCESKTLYVQRFDERDVLKRISAFQNQKDAYHKFELAYIGSEDPFVSRRHSQYLFLSRYYDGSYTDWENAKHWFARVKEQPNELYLNEISKSMIERFILQYQAILDEMDKENTEEKGVHGLVGQKYLEYQLSWFGKIFSETDDITLENKVCATDAFVGFLETYAENKVRLSKEEQEVFREEFTKLYDTAFGRRDRNKGRVYGIIKMNALLQEGGIGYIINKLASDWVVSRHDWEQQL